MKLLDHHRMPTVATLMQPFPYFAEPNTSVADILKLMHDHDIRHIPIKQSDLVVGIISERDLRWMKSPAIAIPAADEILVQHVMTYNPYVVDINTSLITVVSKMTEDKIGAAIVTSSGRLAGIVTVIDLCRALAELLATQYSHS